MLTLTPGLPWTVFKHAFSRRLGTSCPLNLAPWPCHAMTLWWNLASWFCFMLSLWWSCPCCSSSQRSVHYSASRLPPSWLQSQFGRTKNGMAQRGFQSTRLPAMRWGTGGQTWGLGVIRLIEWKAACKMVMTWDDMRMQSGANISFKPPNRQKPWNKRSRQFMCLHCFFHMFEFQQVPQISPQGHKGIVSAHMTTCQACSDLPGRTGWTR